MDPWHGQPESPARSAPSRRNASPAPSPRSCCADKARTPMRLRLPGWDGRSKPEAIQRKATCAHPCRDTIKPAHLNLHPIAGRRGRSCHEIGSGSQPANSPISPLSGTCPFSPGRRCRRASVGASIGKPVENGCDAAATVAGCPHGGSRAALLRRVVPPLPPRHRHGGAAGGLELTGKADAGAVVVAAAIGVAGGEGHRCIAVDPVGKAAAEGKFAAEGRCIHRPAGAAGG